MREIKFRAWDKENKKLISWRDICSYYNLLSMLDPVARDYDRYEVMQYTGLHDKNGKEIYEGDILQWQEANKDHSGYWVVYDHTDFKLWNGKYHKTIIDPTWYEVIGNIYENPELLEG